MTLGRTASGIAFEVVGRPGGRALPVVLVHAGVADRRMWDPVWHELTRDRPGLRLDLRGYGDSVSRPVGALLPYIDVLATLDAAAFDRVHLVGASFGAGVAVETALVEPWRVASLLLAAPGGSLLDSPTEWLRAAWRAETEALAAGDLDAAAEIDVRAFVDGPRRGPDVVDPAVRALVHGMQRRAFEITADWSDVEEDELDPPALQRLAELLAPALVLVGDLDGDAMADAAERVVRDIAGARLVRWPDVAHLPSLERPTDFAALARAWFTEVERR
jgi:pimeloyl-ACP methyl ester carboxylesterase